MSLDNKNRIEELSKMKIVQRTLIHVLNLP